MSSLALSTAISSLNAAQAALSVIGNNVANVNTPGYSRQRVTLSTIGSTNVTNGTLRTGRGVQIASVDRVADSLLNERLRVQGSIVGRYSASTGFYSEIESYLGEPGGTGLSRGLSGLFASLSGLAANPADPSLRDTALRSGSNLAEDFRSLERQLRGVDRSLSDAIRTEVAEINALSAEIFEVNQAIGQAFRPERTPPDLLDRQEALVQQLAERVDVSVSRDATNRIRISAGNTQLVSPSGYTTLETRVTDAQTGRVEVLVAGGSETFRPNDGRLRGLLDVASGADSERFSRLDDLARNLALEVNRVFTTGVPGNGGFTELTSSNRIIDSDRDSDLRDETLATAGLPFAVQNGRLTVNVTNEAGQVSRSVLDIDPATTTVGSLVDQLDAIEGLSAFLDQTGVLRLVAANGSRFDFSNRILTDGDPQGLFGPDRATAFGAVPAPFSISAGSSFDVQLNGGATTTVTFDSNVSDLNAALAEIQADLPPTYEALIVDGALVVRAAAPVPASSTNATGQSSIALTDGLGGPLAALGLPTGTFTADATQPAGVTFGGVYTGTSDLQLTLTPSGPGVIGETDGLFIEVRDASGSVINRLNVGSGYESGTPFELPNGVTVAFEAGRVDPAAGQRVRATFIADSDTADLLPALGLATFFTGSSAADIDVADRVLSNPELLTAGLNAAAGNTANLDRLVAIGDASLANFEGRTLGGEWRDFVDAIGNDSARARNTRDSQALVLTSLRDQREALVGVNLDEELLALEQFQQMYQASATYLQTIQEVQDILFNLV